MLPSMRKNAMPGVRLRSHTGVLQRMRKKSSSEIVFAGNACVPAARCKRGRSLSLGVRRAAGFDPVTKTSPVPFFPTVPPGRRFAIRTFTIRALDGHVVMCAYVVRQSTTRESLATDGTRIAGKIWPQV